MKSLLLALSLATAGNSIFLQNTRAEVRAARVFSSHMVLQQDKPVIVWGWAQPNETITVQLAAENQKVKANEHGEWKASLPPMKAGGPHVLSIQGSSSVRFEDVMVGEVWLCSGQSNMEMGINKVRDATAEIAAANYPGIRLLMVPNRWTPVAQTNIEETAWKVCSPQTVAESGWGGFSAAAYFFGRELHRELGVTVGLIDSTWGGTRIESWTPPEGFAQVPALKRDSELVQLGDPSTVLHQQRLEKTIAETEKWVAEARQAMSHHGVAPAMPTYPTELLPPHDLQNSTALYNGMIYPLRPFALRGAIWYQGESNSDEGMLYAERMKALIQGWRQVWGQGEFPFYFVQIAPYNYGGNPERIAELWEAQAAAQAVPNSGMAVINDIADLKDIHPANKQDVGRRLALWALAKTYGKNTVEYSGPVFKSMSMEGDKLRLQFDHAAGLKSRDAQPLTWFELIDADEGGFVKAEAKLEGSAVVLSSPEVKHPVAMRYAWSMLAEPNLVNSAGLPASAFRAGKVPQRDLLALKVPESKNYQLVYDLDLARLGPTIAYAQDNSAKIHQPFDRIAYFLELAGDDGVPQYVYVSMDAFTQALGKIGVPTVQSGAKFQQNVAHMNVLSNVKGVVTGTNLAGGNLEFWPHNYSPANQANVPNASAQTWDFGDEPSDPAEGYGSMQIHNHDAKQTILAINHWREGNAADLGIGNQPKGNPDWTFAGNAGSYKTRRLRVLVGNK